MADMEAGMFDVDPPVGAGPRSPAVADSQQARSRSPRRPASRRELHRLLSAASSEWDGEQDGPRRALSARPSDADDENSQWSVAANRANPNSATTVSSFPSPSTFLWRDEVVEEQVPASQAPHDGPPSPLPPVAPLVRVADIVQEVGVERCILPASGRSSWADVDEGMAVKLGFEFLVRIALRAINITPRCVQERLALKYGSDGSITERISTTFSGTDTIIDFKLAVITAVRLKVGAIQHLADFLGFSVVQTLAAEQDEWKRDRCIINRTRHPSHTIMHVAKDSFFFCLYRVECAVVVYHGIGMRLSQVCVCVFVYLTIRTRTGSHEESFTVSSTRRRW